MHALLMFLQAAVAHVAPVAADTTHTAAPVVSSPITLSPICVLYGAGISVVVNLLKQYSWIANNPKWAALAASVLVTALSTAIPGMSSGIMTATTLLACVLTQLSAAIATHEVVLSNMTIALPSKKAAPPTP